MESDEKINSVFLKMLEYSSEKEDENLPIILSEEDGLGFDEKREEMIKYLKSDSGIKIQMGAIFKSDSGIRILSPCGTEEYYKKIDAGLTGLLRYIDTWQPIGMLYYPGSGFHKIPKETLGVERVVHLSREEVNYFTHLGDGIKVQADYRHSPFPDKSFDATLIWSTPPDTALEAIPDFRRVTKDNGLIIFSCGELQMQEEYGSIVKELDKTLERIRIPEEYSPIRVYRNSPIMQE